MKILNSKDSIRITVGVVGGGAGGGGEPEVPRKEK